MANDYFDKILFQELVQLEKVQHQNPETGAGINEGTTYIDQYTNRIFGAPFQLMDSVDRRFPSVNKHVGNEYLRNFILNSPILHIKPGTPKYSGGSGSSIAKTLVNLYIGMSRDAGMKFTESLLLNMASSTIFSSGSRLQKRMFGFREQFYQYMSHVNYMCRSMATFLNLTSTTNFPQGTYVNGSGNDYEFSYFKNIKWENYRMLTSAKPLSPIDELKALGGATVLGTVGTAISSFLSGTVNTAKATANEAAAHFTEILNGDASALDSVLNTLINSSSENASSTKSAVLNAADEAEETSISDIMTDKICSVMFMVEPVTFEESLTNQTQPSMIEQALDGVSGQVGSEIAFITNSKVDTKMVGSIAELLGDTIDTAGNFLSGLTENVAGGFTSNLFSGALKSVTGQKMIYPKIYQSSKSQMDYNFIVNLSTPYGDVYNYYMNIIVPLMHLIALASPRMMTSNSIASPYLVQAFIPGMCSCQLGIISNMQIMKNPNGKHVSAQGYPLDITVKFTVEELYNAMSISPANDPASFIFNETLNDYMANLAGLMPSVNTYSNQRLVAFKALSNYMESGDYLQDAANSMLQSVEDFVNPFVGR